MSINPFKSYVICDSVLSMSRLINEMYNAMGDLRGCRSVKFDSPNNL